MTAQKTHPITSGPSKWDLAIALFESEQKLVTFHSNCNLACLIEVSVSSVQSKQDPGNRDRSRGNYWNIEGFATKVFRSSGVRDDFVLPKAGYVFIEYWTDSRIGNIRFQ